MEYHKSRFHQHLAETQSPFLLQSSSKADLPGNCPPIFAPSILTFNLHYLIGVLHHLVLGLIAEGVSPGLDKVQNLTADTCLHLSLHRKGKKKKQKSEKKSLKHRRWVKYYS